MTSTIILDYTASFRAISNPSVCVIRISWRLEVLRLNIPQLSRSAFFSRLDGIKFNRSLLNWDCSSSANLYISST